MRPALVLLRLIWACAFLYIANAGNAQRSYHKTYQAIKWSGEDGLPAGFIHAIFKDANGFLWFGGEKTALSRFDGATFKKYNPEKHNSRSINSDQIYSIMGDKLNNLWISTGAGLSRYDIRADTFTNFTPYKDDLNAGIKMAPFPGNGDEIFIRERGLTISAINIHTLIKREVVRLNKRLDESILWNTNRSFYEKRSDCIWSFQLTNNRYGVIQVFPDGTDSLYSWPCYSGNKIHRHSSENMLYDSLRNSIWVNSGEGLLEFSLADKKFRRAGPWNEMAQNENYDCDVGLDIDREGRIWVATKPEGIFVYDPNTEEIRKLFSDRKLQDEVSENNMKIYYDPDGVVWTSKWSESGVNQLIPVDPLVTRYSGNPSKRDSLSSGLITTVLNGPDGKIWIGTADGLNIFDPVKETFQVLRKKDLPGIIGKAIIPVFIDTVRKKAWLKAGWQNPHQADLYFKMPMYELDISTGRCSKVIFKSGKKVFETVESIFQAVVPGENGFLIVDEKRGVFEVSTEKPTAELVISIDSISRPNGFGGLALIRDRYLFIQHGGFIPNSSYVKKNGKWIKIKHIFDSTAWSVMRYSQADSTLWVATRNELLQFDNDFTLLKSFDEKSGYYGSALNIQIDDPGVLWMVNEFEQITRMDPKEGRITSISELDGYQKQKYYWYAPGLKDKNGSIYFGIGWQLETKIPGSGLDKIVPSRFNESVPVRVYVKSISVNQQPLNSALNPSGIEGLKLEYDQNTVRIEAGIIDFYSKDRGKLRYRVETNGEMGDWLYPPDQIIRFEKLLPGSYRVLMQASDIRNSFSGPEKELKIHIRTPFWQTWWFRILALLTVGTIFYLIVRYRTQQVFRQKLERSEKEKRIAELQQQKTEIEMQALRAQMNPHFIFNSLNSINRFILQNDKAQASEYLTKFSRLVRLILQNSQSSLISLESELDSLHLYLDLEAVRFEHRFGYSVTVPKDMDIEMLKVPPLIIQPYTENAIWHGLMHKEDKGQLDISVSEENEYLVVRIADNGIGREAARAIAGKTTTKHKSFGMKITANRIAMLEKSMDGVSPVTINDLTNPDGSAAGTEVVIKIPVIE